MAPHRYTSKRIAERWRSNNVITSVGLGSVGFCSVSSESFFVVTCTCLSLVLAFDFCNSQLIFFCILFKKRHKNKYIKKNIQIFWKKWIYQRKVRGSHFWTSKGSWGPTFKIWRGSWVPLLNFEEVSRGPGPASHHALMNAPISKTRLDYHWRNQRYSINTQVAVGRNFH